MARMALGAALAALLLPDLAAQEKARPLNAGGLDGPGAVVAGIVRFRGEKPERKPLEGALGNAFCKEACKGQAPLDERWVFGRNGPDDTLQNVLVYVSKGLEGRTFEPPKEPVILDQVNCVYTPHVVGVMAGQTLEIRNSDGTLHNVLCNPRKNRAFNEGMPVKGGKLEKVFKVPELKIDFRCVLHPWMTAYVHVLEHPYYAVTGADGSFVLKGLPPGGYEVTAVHESPQLAAERATAAVKVAGGETKEIEFVYRWGK